jgi:uncharacterized protein YecE (DUF72 family)
MGTDDDPPPKPRQQGLFGPLAGERLPPTVPPAAVDDAVAALARGVPAAVRLGTSSWNFPGWRGLVYAPRAKQEHLSKNGLAAYARHPLLRAVGIDRTFYAPVDRAEFEGYRDQVPADFRFLVKGLGELLTPQLRSGAPNEAWLDAARFAAQCVEPAAAGLGDRLAVLLLQFPPQGAAVTKEPRLFAECLHTFLTKLPRSTRYAVELRDAALVTADYATALRDAGAVHAFAEHPRLPPLAEQRAVCAAGADPGDGPVVVRWMLRRELGYDEAKQRYEPFDRIVDPADDVAATIARLLAEAARAGREALAIVNNKAEGSAPLSVARLAAALAAAI